MGDNTITMSRKIKGVIQLFRPDLSSAAGICVVAGEIIALGGIPSIHSLFYGFVCGFFISSTALILNDYFDIEVDKINAPNRPLPSGAVSPIEAIVLTIAASVLGLTAAAFISMSALIISLILLIIGFLYNWKYKEKGLLGNMMVSLSVAATYFLGGTAVSDPWNKIVITFSAMAFFLDLGEEIAADAMDMEGDKKRNSRSIALKMGYKTAINISSIIFAIVILISLIPLYFGWLGIYYLYMILISDGIILLSTLKLQKSVTPEEGRAIIKQIYRGSLIGLLAFIFSQIFSY